MAKKRFAKLRGALMTRSIDQEYLAEKLGCSVWYVTQRMCGHADWTQRDQYTLMDLLRIPYNEMHEYFPKEGISA
jgi:hypothetical protein